MSKNATAIYLYCVIKAARRPSLARVPAGLTGASAPEAHQVSPSLWLIASQVPLAIYGAPELEARLRDLDWVSRTALAHEAVVEYFARARGTVVIPAKLFTMFSTEARAIDDVARRRVSIDRVVKRIAGCEEWGIRITRRTSPPTPAVPESRPTSGSAFLAAKKAARDAVVKARSEAAAAAEETFRRLAHVSREATQRDRRQEPGTNPPILEAAFLVKATGVTRFKAEARRQTDACAAAGADMTITGPWPAYNFIGTR